MRSFNCVVSIVQASVIVEEFLLDFLILDVTFSMTFLATLVKMAAQVCRDWEAAALNVNKDVRLALIRIGVVLGKDGGALGKMLHVSLIHYIFVV